MAGAKREFLDSQMEEMGSSDNDDGCELGESIADSEDIWFAMRRREISFRHILFVAMLLLYVELVRVCVCVCVCVRTTSNHRFRMPSGGGLTHIRKPSGSGLARTTSNHRFRKPSGPSSSRQ